jgi:hypothetical protein
MKKYLFGALVAVTGLIALATGAQAQTGSIVVHIHQDFIAGNRMFPAGTYKIGQDLSGSAPLLVLRGTKPGAASFVLATTLDSSSPQQLKVKLTRLGDVYYLSEVATETGVYTLAPTKYVTRMARATDLSGMPSSGSN